MEPRCESFLGLDPGQCPAYADCRVVVLPVPYDGTASYRGGTRQGPRAIIEASRQVELWDLELRTEAWKVGIHLAQDLEPEVAGPERVVQQVEQACAAHTGKRVLLLGGEHTVAVGAVRALCALEPGERPTSVLQVDAHLDLRDSYEGSGFSHACVARRLLELGTGVVHVGARVACPEEMKAVAEHRLSPVWAHEVRGEEDAPWIDRTVAALGERVYVSVDLDGLDPAVVPGTGTPVPGGLGWYQVLALLRAVGEQREVVGADLCELAPIAGQNVSEFAAAQLAYKMIGYFWR